MRDKRYAIQRAAFKVPAEIYAAATHRLAFGKRVAGVFGSIYQILSKYIAYSCSKKQKSCK